MSELSDIPRGYSRAAGNTDTLFSSSDDIVHKQQQMSLSPIGSPVERRLTQSAPPVHNQTYSLFCSNPVSSVLYPDTESSKTQIGITPVSEAHEGFMRERAQEDVDLQQTPGFSNSSWDDDYFVDGLDLSESKRKSFPGTNTTTSNNGIIAQEGPRQRDIPKQIPPLLKSLSADSTLSFLSVGIGPINNHLGTDGNPSLSSAPWLPSFKSLPNLPTSNAAHSLSLSSPSSPSASSSSSSSLSSSPVISPVLPSLTFTHPTSVDNSSASGTKFSGSNYLSSFSTSTSPRQFATNTSTSTTFHGHHSQAQLASSASPFPMGTTAMPPNVSSSNLSSSYSPTSPSKSPTRSRTLSPQSLPHSHPSLLQSSQTTSSASGSPTSPGRRTHNYPGSRGGGSASSQPTNGSVGNGGTRNKSPLRRGSPLRSSPPLSPHRNNQLDSAQNSRGYRLPPSGFNGHSNSVPVTSKYSSDDSDSETESNDRNFMNTQYQYGKQSSFISPNGPLPSTLSSSPTSVPLSVSPSLQTASLSGVNWPSLGSSNSIPTTSNNSSVPSSKSSHSSFDLNLDRVKTGLDKRTTLMIKNIPNKYNQDMILETFHNHGFSGSFDFFYLPIDFKNKCNVGYAFINFIDPATVASFYVAFNQTKWEKFNSEKICTITYARIQGKHALIDHFRNSSLMYEDPACRPLIFHSSGPSVGTLEPFPVAANNLLNGSRNQRVAPGKQNSSTVKTPHALFNQQGTL